MSTLLHNSQIIQRDNSLNADVVSHQRFVMADWNSRITSALTEGAVKTLLDCGAQEDNIKVVHVPGTIELTFAAAKYMDFCDAIIVIGCVIKGETPHFDYVCSSVTQGVTILNAQGKTPVIFSVLTTLNEQQALDRAGGSLGNKGAEGAMAALSMIEVARML